MEQTRRARFLVDAALTRLSRGETTPALYGLWEALRALDPAPRGEDRFWRASALYHYGVALSQAGVPDKALASFADCLASFGGGDEDPQTASFATQSAISAAISAFGAGRADDALRYLDTATERLHPAQGVDDRRALARALVNRAAILRRSERLDDAERAYDAAHARFRDDDDPAISREIALVLHEKAKMLEGAGATDRAAAAFREFLKAFGSSPDPAIAERVREAESWLAGRPGATDPPRASAVTASRRGRVLVEQGTGSLQRGAPDAAIDQLDAAVDALGVASHGEDRTWVARAIHNRAMALQALERHAEAVETFRSIQTRFGDAPEDDVRQLVTSALTNAAVSAGSTGKFDEALGFVDDVIRQLGDARTLDDRRTLANVLYNRATLLKMAGRIEAAAAAFDATCNRFLADDDPKVCRFVALAVFNKADALANAELPERALPAFRRAIDVCRASADPVIRERAARSFMGLAGNLAALGRETDCAAVLEELVAAFGSAPEPAIQQLVGQALVAQPALLLKLPPAKHSWDSDCNRQMFGSIINDYQDRPDLIERKLTEWATLLDDRAARDATGHAEALAVVEAFWRNSTPFALFLRNFASEAADIAVPMGLEFPFRASFQTPGYSSQVEARILAAVGGLVPVISIANPSPNLTRPDRIPKLEVDNDLWQSVLQILVDSAGLIVVLLHTASRGVFEEMEMIVQRGRQADTLLIVAPSVVEQVPVIADLKAAQLAGGRAPENREIPRFGVVLDSGDLPEAGSAPLASVTDLIRRVKRGR